MVYDDQLKQFKKKERKKRILNISNNIKVKLKEMITVNNWCSTTDLQLANEKKTETTLLTGMRIPKVIKIKIDNYNLRK